MGLSNWEEIESRAGERGACHYHHHKGQKIDGGMNR